MAKAEFRTRRSRAWLVSMTLVLVAACAGRSTSGSAVPLRGHGAIIEVRNDEFDDTIVYLIRGGTPIPLGVVPGASRRTFRVREGELGNGNGVALGTGHRGGPVQHVTTPFDLAPGRIATWIVRSSDRVDQPIVR